MSPSLALAAAAVGRSVWVVAQADGLLPEGFVVPPVAYAIVLVLGVLTAGALLWSLSPPVTHQTVLALGAWMMVGGTLHAISRIRPMPDLVEPLLESPAIYATVAVVTGTVWVVTTLYGAMTNHSPDRTLGIVGGAVLVALFAWGIVYAVVQGTLAPLPAAISLVGAGVTAAITWLALSLYWTDTAAITSWTGAVVVFSHSLDGVTTAVGHDMLGAEELTPLSAELLRLGELLPTAEYVGAGWVFVFVKIFLASVVLILFRDWVREQPRTALLALALIAAVGLGPGTHNLVLFALGGGG